MEIDSCWVNRPDSLRPVLDEPEPDDSDRQAYYLKHRDELDFLVRELFADNPSLTPGMIAKAMKVTRNLVKSSVRRQKIKFDDNTLEWIQ